MASVTLSTGPDTAGTLLTSLIKSATTSLRIAVYEMGDSYSWAPIAAHRRGVDTRVIVDTSDGRNDEAVDSLRAAAVPLRLRGGADWESHWKVVVVDNARLAVGTGNLVVRDARRDPHGRCYPDPLSVALAGTREWWVFVDDAPSLVGAACAAFDAAFGSGPSVATVVAGAAIADYPDVHVPLPRIAPVHLSVSDEAMSFVGGGAAIAQSLRQLLRTCERCIWVTVPYIHDVVATRALLAIMQPFVECRDVRILLGGPDDATMAQLQAQGIAVRTMDPARSTVGHAKGIIVDGNVVVTSANWSDHGLGKNDEAALMIRDSAAANYYASVFDQDWAASPA